MVSRRRGHALAQRWCDWDAGERRNGPLWYSPLTPRRDGLLVEHRPLSYDYSAAMAAMRRAGLPARYEEALGNGIWPSCDVLPPEERAQTGVALDPATFLWGS
jgi:hypothetical protein